MSDRASTQKSFNALLAEYRESILPTVTKNWEGLTAHEKQSMSHMHNFYCGMHLVVNMAEHASEALKLIERNHDPNSNRMEPGTLRLIRMACKAFEKRGCEKSGYPVQFASFLKRKGLAKNPLIHFRGNRFNVIFANGARVYTLRNYIKEFLTTVWGTPNRLLKAVLEDMAVCVYTAGCRALGLIDKLITGPLWRILESDVHVLDIPEYYKKSKTFFSECTVQNIDEVMSGAKTPFENPDLINKDEIWNQLTSQSDNDTLVGHILLSLFKTFELLLENVLRDYEPALLAAAEHPEKVRSETAVVKTTNTISERDFGQLDRLLREKPNASAIALEAHILFSNNKTSKWIMGKTVEERAVLLEKARKNAPCHRQKYRMQLEKLEKERIKKQEEKERERVVAERRSIEMKEKITSELIDYGLWISAQQVDSALRAMKSETQKRTALKAQIRFRKVLLKQAPTNESTYKFSSKEKGQFTSETLKDNLLSLIQVHDVATEHSSSMSSCNLEGKTIKHLFEVDGKQKTFTGKVISQVPGFPEWYNVVYTKEPDVIYTYKLEDDIQNGDLKVCT